MPSTTSRFAELQAPAHWQVVDFISDLHLQSTEPATAQAWRDYLAATPAQAVFLLGDLFEVWVGDDGPEGDDEDAAFERQCLAHLKRTSERCALYVMHGNRDFLFGASAAQRAGCKLMDDPTVLIWGEERWLLSHGDALCLDDQAYQAFRAQVRAPTWQEKFLSQPLVARRQFARGVRAQSEARKRTEPGYSDVDATMVQTWLQQSQAHTLIHGHTHQPADHTLAQGAMRRVLSDWDCDATPPRAEVLRLSFAPLRSSNARATVQRLPLTEAIR
jgi:UDP-2,3-diacylglucosamine hydrolase